MVTLYTFRKEGLTVDNASRNRTAGDGVTTLYLQQDPIIFRLLATTSLMLGFSCYSHEHGGRRAMVRLRRNPQTRI